VIGNDSDDPAITKENYDIANPSDTNLVKIYGYAKLKDGTPVPGVSCSAVWKYYISSWGQVLFFQEYNSDFSDQDGYFEILVPKSKIIHFIATKKRYPDQLLASCFEFFSDKNPVGELSQRDYMELGEFENDHEVNLRQDIEFLTLRGNVKGKVLSCEGLPVENGKIKLMLWFKNFVPYFIKQNYFSFNNGEFDLSFEICPIENSTPDDYKIKVFVEDTISKYSGEKEIAYSEITDLGNINLCFDDNEHPGELSLTLGTEEKLFPRAFDNERSGKNELQLSFLYENGDEYHSVYLATDQIQVGEVPVLWFKYWKGKKQNDGTVQIYETTFDAKPDEVKMTITKIENDYIYGNVVGNVNTPKGRKPVTATFRAYNK
jgi:hypothetical protein